MGAGLGARALPSAPVQLLPAFLPRAPGFGGLFRGDGVAAVKGVVRARGGRGLRVGPVRQVLGRGEGAAPLQRLPVPELSSLGPAGGGLQDRRGQKRSVRANLGLTAELRLTD